MRGWFVVSILGVACGDDSSGKPAASPSEEELPPGTVEIDPSDAPSAAELSNATEPSDLEPTADESDGRYRAFLDALAGSFRARCDCQFAELGHPSAYVCFERLRKQDFVEACELGAFGLYGEDLGGRYACLGQLRDESVACIEARGCEALDACEAERTAARTRCGPPVYADVEFSNFAAGCERLGRFGIGAGAACPDASVPCSPGKRCSRATPTALATTSR